MDAPPLPRMSLVLDRVYAPCAKDQKKRFMTILVDRLWPRGIRKEALPLDLWAREWAPSTGLRKKFHDGTLDFRSFRLEYRKEIGEKREGIVSFFQKNPPHTVFLLYGSTDPVRNNAAVLKEVLEEWMGDGNPGMAP